MGMSESQAHHYITPEQWSWLLCSVSAIPVKNMLLQELNLLIGIKMLTSDFIDIFGSKFNFWEANARSSPPADTHESSSPYLLNMIWQPYS